MRPRVPRAAIFAPVPDGFAHILEFSRIIDVALATALMSADTWSAFLKPEKSSLRAAGVILFQLVSNVSGLQASPASF